MEARSFRSKGEEGERREKDHWGLLEEGAEGGKAVLAVQDDDGKTVQISALKQKVSAWQADWEEEDEEKG